MLLKEQIQGFTPNLGLMENIKGFLRCKNPLRLMKAILDKLSPFNV